MEKTHGMSSSKLYNRFRAMHDRCENTKNKAYVRYGARGISVCDEWSGVDGFVHFMEWAVNSGYDETASFGICTLERIDNSKGYSPDNCKWADMEEQCNNRRSNHLVEYNGEAITVTEFARKHNIPAGAVMRRLRSGWSLDEIISIPLTKGNNQCLRTNKYLFEHNGETKSLPEWAKCFGIKKATLRARLKRGWSFEDALKRPVQIKSMTANKGE